MLWGFTIGLAVLIISCGYHTPVAPSAVVVATPGGPATPPYYSVPFSINDTFRSAPCTYYVTAPTSGTLFIRLSFNSYSGFRLFFSVGTVAFHSSGPVWSPVIGRWPVTAGKTYQVTVDQSATIASGNPSDAFVLSADLE